MEPVYKFSFSFNVKKECSEESPDKEQSAQDFSDQIEQQHMKEEQKQLE